MRWQADRIHPLRKLYRRGELNQGDVIVESAWTVVTWMRNDFYGAHLLFCSLICISIVVTNDNFIVPGIPTKNEWKAKNLQTTVNAVTHLNSTLTTPSLLAAFNSFRSKRIIIFPPHRLGSKLLLEKYSIKDKELTNSQQHSGQQLLSSQQKLMIRHK